MPKVIFLIGVYGAGKSHFVEEMFAKGTWSKDEFEVVSVDIFLKAIAKEKNITHDAAYKNYVQDGDTYGINDENICGNDMCCDLIKKTVKKKKNIVIDNPSMSAQIRRRYIDMIPKDYTIEAVYFEIIDQQAFLERLAKRNNSDKTISFDRAIHALKSIEPPTTEEGFDKIEIISNI